MQPPAPRHPSPPAGDISPAVSGDVSRYGRRRRAAAIKAVVYDEEEEESPPPELRRRGGGKPGAKATSATKRARVSTSAEEAAAAQQQQQQAQQRVQAQQQAQAQQQQAQQAQAQAQQQQAQQAQAQAQAQQQQQAAAGMAPNGLLPLGAGADGPSGTLAALAGIDPTTAANNRLLAAAAAGRQMMPGQDLLMQLQAAMQQGMPLPGGMPFGRPGEQPNLLAAAGAAAAALARQQAGLPVQGGGDNAWAGLPQGSGGLPFGSNGLLSLAGQQQQSQLQQLAGLAGPGGFALAAAMAAQQQQQQPQPARAQLGGLPWPLLSAIRERANMQQQEMEWRRLQEAAPGAAGMAPGLPGLPPNLQRRLQAMQAARAQALTGAGAQMRQDAPPPNLVGQGAIQASVAAPPPGPTASGPGPFNPFASPAAAAQAAASAAMQDGPSQLQQLQQLQQHQHQLLQHQQLQGLASNFSGGPLGMGMGSALLGSLQLSGPVPLTAIPGTLSADLHTLYSAWQDGNISFLDP